MSDQPVWAQDPYEPEPMIYLIDYYAYGKRKIRRPDQPKEELE